MGQWGTKRTKWVKGKQKLKKWKYFVKKKRKSVRKRGECSGENKSRKRIGDQSGSVHCCPTWSPPNDPDADEVDDVDDDAGDDDDGGGGGSIVDNEVCNGI